MRERILQANLNNLGGAFSVAYEAQKELTEEYVFDYFFPEEFVKNDIYSDLIGMGSKCVGKIDCRNRLLKQYTVYKTLLKYLKENSYRFVHIHSDTAWKAAVYYLAAKKAGITDIVVHSHSSGIGGHYRIVNRLLHLMCRPLVKRAKYKCACSDVAAKWMFGNSEIVTIIQNGVDIERFRFDEKKRNGIRKQYDIKDNVKIIGSVSDFSYPKNPEFIFRLIKRLKNDNNYIFMFVGNRSGCKLKELVESDSEIKNVVFTGMITNVEAYLSAMDIFILPSRFEGLPMSALEAQVSGLYTIVSDKVTSATRTSRYFGRLELNDKVWEKEIRNADTVHDRNNMNAFLKKARTSSIGTAEGFRMIYKGGV